MDDPRRRSPHHRRANPVHLRTGSEAPEEQVTANRIRDRLIVIIGDNVSPSGGAARWELYDAALGILSELSVIPGIPEAISRVVPEWPSSIRTSMSALTVSIGTVLRE